jgi:hypothetical protein
MMPVLNFEEVLPAFNINGQVGLFEGPSLQGWPAAPQNQDFIQTDQPWVVCTQFQTTGLLCPLLTGNHWKFCLLLEKMGGGEINLNPCVQMQYQPGNAFACIPVQAGQVPEGTYRIIATLRLYSPNNNPGPVAAFVDLGLVQFYND